MSKSTEDPAKKQTRNAANRARRGLWSHGLSSDQWRQRQRQQQAQSTSLAASSAAQAAAVAPAAVASFAQRTGATAEAAEAIPCRSKRQHQPLCYTLLGIGRNSTPGAPRKAYSVKALAWHPVKHKGKEGKDTWR